MNRVFKLSLTAIIISAFCLFSGCLFPWVGAHEQSISEQAVDEIYNVSNADQRDYLANLSTVEQTTEYIDNFWKQHDPTPNTDENEFMQIYYSRLDYANSHFKEMLLPGSKTERGRLYILYGPPDEINEEPMINDLLETERDRRYILNSRPDDLYDERINITSSSYFAPNNRDARIKAYIVWEYDRPANIAFSELFTGKKHTYMYFTFADLDGLGEYVLINSSEDEELIDVRPWQ